MQNKNVIQSTQDMEIIN